MKNADWKLALIPRLASDQSSKPKARTARSLKVCLAASGGGHVRQLLDLEEVWSQHDYYFVTEDTALSRTLAQKHPVEYVAHFALGQARLGNPLNMLLQGGRNFFQSARAILRKPPDFVISTGAGAAFFAVLFAKAVGAKVIMIESFARFDKPSMFTRLVAPLANYKIVQSAALRKFMPDAEVFDPLRVLEQPRPPKKNLLFVTVGSTLPFDRLVNSVMHLKSTGAIDEEVVVQSGVGGTRPEGIESFETLPFDTVKSYLQAADIVVCHGGTGSLITALREGCRVIVMPREFSRGEHYDDHQSEIASAFAARGLVFVARDIDELRSALISIRRLPARTATTDTSEISKYLGSVLLSDA